MAILGMDGLGLRQRVIDAALYNKKDIQSATREDLSTWFKGQNNRREAFLNLHAGLRKCEMNHLAFDLKQWVDSETAELTGMLVATTEKTTTTDSRSSMTTHKFDFSATAESSSEQQNTTSTEAAPLLPIGREYTAMKVSTSEQLLSSTSAATSFHQSPKVPSWRHQKFTPIKRTGSRAQSSASSKKSRTDQESPGADSRSLKSLLMSSATASPVDKSETREYGE